MGGLHAQSESRPVAPLHRPAGGPAASGLRLRALIAIITLTLLLDAVGIAVLHLHVPLGGGLLKAGVAIAVSLALAAISRVPRYRAMAPVIRHTLIVIWSLAIFSLAAITLQYLAVALDAPLADSRLIALDARLGFNWHAFAA